LCVAPTKENCNRVLKLLDIPMAARVDIPSIEYTITLAESRYGNLQMFLCVTVIAYDNSG
jgi:hypothetical protein